MDRQKYYDAAKKSLENNIFFHSLALEACMGGLYDYFSENNLIENEPTKEEWMIAGLVHDIDYRPPYKEMHPEKTREALAEYDLEISDTIFEIVRAHSGVLVPEPKNKAEWSIRCADSLTGLIVAVALVYPTKKLEDVKLSSVMKRLLKEPKFAAGTRREEVKMCEREDGLNLPLEKFVEICLVSMQKIAGEIGL